MIAPLSKIGLVGHSEGVADDARAINMIEASKSDLLRPAGSSGEDNSPVDIDALLQSILGRGAKRFGMAAAILRGERIIAQGVAGVRKRGTAERITLEDRFHLGSCTKAMTATLVAMLVEEGKLNWTTTLGELFAGKVKPMHPVWEKVTLRQVLAHRAGLRLEPDGLRAFNEMVRPPRAWLGTLPQQRREIAKQALSRPPGIAPDTKYWYSNVGYVLTGAVLEQLTGSGVGRADARTTVSPTGHQHGRIRAAGHR